MQELPGTVETRLHGILRRIEQDSDFGHAGTQPIDHMDRDPVPATRESPRR